MRRFVLLTIASVVFALQATALASQAEAAQPKFEVTITNLTAAQTFTPILVATAKRGVHIFELGQPASLPMQHLAEAGDTSQLTTELMQSSGVLDIETASGPLAPGASVTLTVRTGNHFNRLILASMLVPTNAGFFALNGVKGPSGRHSITFYSPAYDAGSKPDDELCANIPGPPDVCNGTGFVPQPSSGVVGYVFIHRGIHGIGNLDAATYDWRYPVARIVVKRVPGNSH